MEQTRIAELAKARHPFRAETARIPGWGIDAPIERRVGVPKDGDLRPSENGAYWDAPEQQKRTVKIHVSTERPGLTPVFGTSCPPKGLSGIIRDAAYRYSEGKRRHWLMLMLADRVDVVESALSDFVFHPPETRNGSRKIRRDRVVLGAAALAVGAFLVANGTFKERKAAAK